MSAALTSPGLASRVRWHMREAVAGNARLWQTVHTLRGATHGMTARETDLVVEGYPRSGNSFAESAISLLEPSLRLAHHRHVAAQFLLARRWGIPALLLIREPADAAASAVFRAPDLATPEQALRQWISFHNACEPACDAMVVSDFGTTTGDFGAVIAGLNDRFGLSLPAPEPDFADAAYAEIARKSAMRTATSRLNYSPDMTQREKDERRRQIESIRHNMEARNPRLIDEARGLSRKWQGRAVSGGAPAR